MLRPLPACEQVKLILMPLTADFFRLRPALGVPPQCRNAKLSPWAGQREQVYCKSSRGPLPLHFGPTHPSPCLTLMGPTGIFPMPVSPSLKGA